MPQVALRLHARELISVKVQPRQERGTGAMSQMRRNQGLVPGILYGHKQTPLAFKTEARTLQRIFTRFGQNILFTVEFDGGDQASQQAIVRDVQYHKVRGEILHLDLLRIDPQERRVVTVPVHTQGVPEGVRTGGGALQHAVTTLEMECVVSDMPSSIEIDISSLQIGDSIHVADLLEQEPRIVTEPEVTIVNVLAPRLTIDDELERAAAEEAEGVEGVEGVEGEESEEGAEKDGEAKA